MQAFPTGYAPQSGYPTQGPYNPDIQGQTPAQIQQQPEIMPDPNSQEVQPVPSQMQPQMSAPIMQPSMGPMPYNYYPPQPPQMAGYNQFPLPQPMMTGYNPQTSSDSDDDDDSNSECHEVIGITLGGKPCPSPQNPVVCCDCKLHRKQKKGLKKCKRSKQKEDPKEGESPCAHTFCIIERAKIKPIGRPWASGLYKYQPMPEEPPKTKIIRRKCNCATQKSQEDEYESVESCSSMSNSTISTMSSASTASRGTSNQMLEFMEVFCSLLEMTKKNSKLQKQQKKTKSCHCSEAKPRSFCYDD